MKQLKVFALILVAGFIAFTSCKKEEPEGPTLTISADVTSAWQGDTITFTYSVASNEDLELLSWTTTASSIAPAGEVALTGTSVSSKTIEVILPTSGVTEGTLKFTFVATDKDGEEYADTKEITITLEEPAPASTPFATTITTGKIYHILAPELASWDLVNNVAVSSSASDAVIYIQNNDVAGLVTGKFKSKNTCDFVKTTEDFNTIDVEKATAAYAAGTPSTTINTVAVNDVYVAKKGSELYVIKITALSTTDGTSTAGNKGSMSFSYKK